MMTVVVRPLGWNDGGVYYDGGDDNGCDDDHDVGDDVDDDLEDDTYDADADMSIDDHLDSVVKVEVRLARDHVRHPGCRRRARRVKNPEA